MKADFLIYLIILMIFSPCISAGKSGEAGNGDRVGLAGHRRILCDLVKIKEITPTGKMYRRPDAVLLKDQIYITFADESGFLLARVSEDLNVTVLGELTNSSDEFATDVRLATDGDNIWYAMETIRNLISPECGKNFLNIAKYSLEKKESKRSAHYNHITSGCPTMPRFIPSLIHSPLLPRDAKAVDDPTPIFIENHYFIMVRGWIGKQKQYIYKIDREFNLIEETKIDLKKFIGNGMLSQNTFVDIDGQIYLISGVSSGPPIGNNFSEIKAFPFSNDLKKINGDVIDLLPTNEHFFTRVTSASYYKKKLFFNLLKKTKAGGETKGYIAVLNPHNEFQAEDYIIFQDRSAKDNHSSFVIVNDKIFIFYQTPHKSIMAKVFTISDQDNPTQHSDSMTTKEKITAKNNFCGDGICGIDEQIFSMCRKDCPDQVVSKDNKQGYYKKSQLCGDGFCDEHELRSGMCKQDCPNQISPSDHN